MNKAVLATLCITAGVSFGFTVRYFVYNKDKNEDKEFVEPIQVETPVKTEEPKEEKPQDEFAGVKPARIAKHEGEVGINYTEFVKDLKYKQETASPSEDDTYDTGEGDGETDDEEEDMKDYEETYEERVERESEEALEHSEKYKKAHAGKIELMTSDEWDTDYPESDYEREDLYYFTEDDVLTDEDGHKLDEAEYIGPKPRQVGWMRSKDENIYVRNHPKEKEYRVFKEFCTVEDWF
jgi:hypothetical protein